MQTKIKFIICIFLLTGCVQAKKGSSLEVLVPAINTQVKDFIKTARYRSHDTSHILTVYFHKKGNLFRVNFDFIEPGKCNNYLGFVKYDNDTVCFFGDKEAEKFFKKIYISSCDDFVDKQMHKIPLMIDWYSNVYFFDGKIFTHVPTPKDAY